MPELVPAETYRFLLAPHLQALVTFEGAPVTVRDLRMLQRYLALAELALADAGEDEPHA